MSTRRTVPRPLPSQASTALALFVRRYRAHNDAIAKRQALDALWDRISQHDSEPPPSGP